MSDKTKRYIVMHGYFDDENFDLVLDRNLKNVVVLEGRPSLTSSKRMSRELNKRGIRPTLIADNMAGFLFYRGMVDEVWLSYTEADASGALCTIGSSILAILAQKHKVPVKVFPTSRRTKFLGNQKELTHFQGVRVAPMNVKAYVPLVEWVPIKYINVVQPEFATL